MVPNAVNAINSTLTKLLESYKEWIKTNSQLLSDIEATIRCLSYFSGYVANSKLLLELTYSLPNLFVLFNDLLIYSTRTDLKLEQFESKIKILLVIVEYTETLFEVSAEDLYGKRGKWFIISMIQVAKSIMRLMLIYLYKERLTKHPAIAPLNREVFKKVTQLKNGFILKRSGAVVRDVKNALPVQMRTWKPLSNSNKGENENLTKIHESEQNLKLAESLYVIRPLLHLGSMFVTNRQHWLPWLLSLAIDIASLNMHIRSTQLTEVEKNEIMRRKISLLLYILRSPFYEKYSRDKIFSLADSMSSIPFAKILTDTIKKNLPYLQNIHFYMWSS